MSHCTDSLYKLLGVGGNQGTRLYREAGYFYWFCSRNDDEYQYQEGRPAGQRQSGAGAGMKFLVLFRTIEFL